MGANVDWANNPMNPSWNPGNAGLYWKTPNELAEIPSPQVAQQAGAAANAYQTAANPSLTGLLNAAGGGQQQSGGGGLFGGGTTSPMGAPTGGVTGGGAGITAGSQIPGVGPIDNSAAQSAAFGAAKDTAGQIGRSSLDTLRGVMGETGQLGGGAEVQGSRDIVESAMGQVGDVNREGAVNQANQALDIAKTNQGAAITQRGQDIASQEANARLAQEQASLSSQRQLELLRLAITGQGQQAGGFSNLY
jgi:hypothetical protein